MAIIASPPRFSWGMNSVTNVVDALCIQPLSLGASALRTPVSSLCMDRTQETEAGPALKGFKSLVCFFEGVEDTERVENTSFCEWYPSLLRDCLGDPLIGDTIAHRLVNNFNLHTLVILNWLFVRFWKRSRDAMAMLIPVDVGKTILKRAVGN